MFSWATRRARVSHSVRSLTFHVVPFSLFHIVRWAIHPGVAISYHRAGAATPDACPLRTARPRGHSSRRLVTNKVIGLYSSRPVIGIRSGLPQMLRWLWHSAIALRNAERRRVTVDGGRQPSTDCLDGV